MIITDPRVNPLDPKNELLPQLSDSPETPISSGQHQQLEAEIHTKKCSETQDEIKEPGFFKCKASSEEDSIDKKECPPKHIKRKNSFKVE